MSSGARFQLQVHQSPQAKPLPYTALYLYKHACTFACECLYVYIILYHVLKSSKIVHEVSRGAARSWVRLGLSWRHGCLPQGVWLCINTFPVSSKDWAQGGRKSLRSRNNVCNAFSSRPCVKMSCRNCWKKCWRCVRVHFISLAVPVEEGWKMGKVGGGARGGRTWKGVHRDSITEEPLASSYKLVTI